MKYRHVLIAATLFCSICCCITIVARAETIGGYAAMGDSLTQGSTLAGSWVPHLVTDRGFNFGGSGNPYNVAVGGATSSSLLSGGQHTAVATQVAANNVDLAYLMIGGNDILAVGTQIIDGSLTGGALDTFVNNMVANIATAADTVLAAGPVGLVVVGVPDVSLIPAGLALIDSPVKKQRVVDATDQMTAAIAAMAAARWLPFVDLAQAQRDMDALPSLVVGGVTINETVPSSNPHHLFQDAIHPGAVGNGLIANMLLTAVNVPYCTEFVPLSDLEILQNAGLSGEYTGETLTLDYTDYVVFTPVEGDVDGDRDIDFTDFLMLQVGYGITSGAHRCDGDLDDDGDVDFQDFLILQVHFGADQADHAFGSSSSLITAVPEPSTLALAVGAVITIALGRRSRNRWVRQAKRGRTI